MTQKAKITMGERVYEGEIDIDTVKEPHADNIHSWAFNTDGFPYEGVCLVSSFSGFPTRKAALADAKAHGIEVIE